MSHLVNDQIADTAVDMVADMSDSKVVRQLADLAPGALFLPSLDMDAKRDMLVDIYFQQLMDRPGPHG